MSKKELPKDAIKAQAEEDAKADAQRAYDALRSKGLTHEETKKFMVENAQQRALESFRRRFGPPPEDNLN
jgi:hypothetical protein